MKAPSRIDASPLARWFWSVDRVALALIAAILVIGLVILTAAGPAAAQRLKIDDEFHFLLRQLLFAGPALALMIGVSLLSPLGARRAGAVVFAASFALLVAALFFAPETNGSKRWFYVGAFGLQPSEIAKPGFTIVAAWMLAEGARNPSFPGAAIAGGLFAVLMAMLVTQPDYGQAALLTAVWMTMFFVIGWNWASIVLIGAGGVGALVCGYFFSPHLARRIDSFLNPEDSAGAYQAQKSLEAFAHGGAFGRGGEGASVKMQLPDAHTDYVFAVAGEEFGFLLCLVVLALYAALTVRLLMSATNQKSLFAQCAVAGLAAQIGLQSLVNMGVALRALPAKGMTLPFISYGGSSLLATAFAFGLALALTRTPQMVRHRREFMP
ncbi:MAG: putative peptidoglycan glycosyltransferase FtsW [Parvularculaceae bacterium]